MLEIKDLHVSYGGIQALRGVSLNVPDGKIVTLIGANGAGKSTLMRTISGLVKAQSGSILWNGQELLGKPIDQIVASGIAMSPEGRRVFADLTVLENLKIGAYLRKDKAETEKDLEWVYSLFPRLKERSWQSAGTLSGGEQQMLAVGRALMSKPKLLMLDEPSLGLAPIVVREIFDIIRTVNQQGITVLLNEQNANMALKVADYAYVLETGTPTLSGTGSECSRTCVLTNIPKNLKLGMNSDYTVYDQLLLDPDLLATVPRDQYFYTGIDTFMHCVESLQGSYRNAIIDAFSVRAVQLCEEIFLSDDMMSEENREKMMIASYIGGMAAGNVGVIHPFSAGLGVVLHVAHGLGNCLALNVLGDIYPKEYKQFRTMIERQGVNLPTGICKDLTEEQYEGLYRGCIVHEKPLTNALGPDFKQILTKENLIERYKSI